MGNITDDIRQHFDTFAELPFTEADSLALSQLAYARMPDNVPRYHENAETADGMIATVPIHDLLRAECYDDMFGKVWSPSMNVDLLRAMSESPRWRNLRVGAYVDEFDAETTKQFSACVFELGNGTLYVAFRGVFCQVGVGRFGVSFSPCERRVSGRFGVGRSCWLLVIALVIA